MKIDEVLNKEQLEEVKVVGAKLKQLKKRINNVIEGNTEMEKILIKIVEEDAKSIIESVVDSAFFEYMNTIKEE